MLDADGVKEYGEKAKYGALIIWVSEEYYDEAIKALRARKNIQ